MYGEYFEEFIYEWYMLKGYLCIRKIPGAPIKKGGRDEIDLLAIMFKNNKVEEVNWIEITAHLVNGKKTLDKKFTNEKERYIKKYLLKFLNIDVTSDIIKTCYTLTNHKKIKKDPSLKCALLAWDDIEDQINKDIESYKYNYKIISKSKSNIEELTLPDTFALMKFTMDD
jgi:hypothetical protein